ncbi:MLO-like protein 13 [Frankliniella fusca]|uniref:MLO-like protein 13 n=1 Tax=Frankliniella fusca TaxID=407009 RepID=A0AAE1HBS2_9NEOP|nr:MLO-like protein 13 [Frankliniella fusca]
MLASTLEFGGGRVAKWRHLIEYFKLDECLYKMSPLTYKHLNPQGIDKMKVSYAAQTLSQSRATAGKTFHALSNNLAHSLPFADFCNTCGIPYNDVDDSLV